MKKIVLVAASLAAVAVSAANLEKFGALTNTLAVMSAKTTTMTTKELTQYAKDSAEMMALLTAMYERDCQTAAGRVKWHGNLKNQIVKTNELVKVTVYADGTEFTEPWKLITPASSVANFNSRVAVSTNGVPAALAAARLRRQQELAKGTNEVTVVTEVAPKKKD